MFEFKVLDRVINRTAPTSTREVNDLVLLGKTRKTKKDGETIESHYDSFRFSTTKFEETKLSGDFGVIALTAEGKVFFAVVPSEQANAFQGRNKDVVKKSPEGGYNEAVEQLVEGGFIATERNSDYRAAFDLVPVSAEHLEIARQGVSPDVDNVYELVPAELIQFRQKGAESNGIDTGASAEGEAEAIDEADAVIADDVDSADEEIEGEEY